MNRKVVIPTILNRSETNDVPTKIKLRRKYKENLRV